MPITIANHAMIGKVTDSRWFPESPEVGFFDKQAKELEARGLDSARLPPGQYLTDRFPVLHVGVVPDVDPAALPSLTFLEALTGDR